MVLVVVAVRGLMHHTRVLPQVARGPARLYSSTADSQKNVAVPPVRATPPAASPAKQTKTAGVTVPPAKSTTPVRRPATRQAAQNVSAVSPLSARFSVLVHQALASDPHGGTESQFFARLGNLVNGTALPPAEKIPAIADHLARAQADLDHANLAGAVAEIGQLSGPAAAVMRPWVADARTRLASEHHGRSPDRVAQTAPPTRHWPNVMPTEIPPYARQSTGPAPAP
jgi:hypothetical protein